MKIFVGISGASGSIYGGRLLQVLKESGIDITACISDGALEVMAYEENPGVGIGPGPTAGSPDETTSGFSAKRESVTSAFLELHGIDSGEIELADPRDMASAFASGSSLADAAVVCPCSMSTLASIASGITRNLIHRVADVMLKESRPLALVPRETPLSEIHLRNMLRVKRAGALLIPAMPGFYHHPETIDDLVDFVVGKVLDSLGIRNEIFERWQGS